MFEFIKNIKLIKEQNVKIDTKINDIKAENEKADTKLNDIIEQNETKLNSIKETVEKKLDVQTMKIEELLDSIIELEDIIKENDSKNVINKDDDNTKNLVMTIISLYDSLKMVINFIENTENMNAQWIKQLDIIKTNINKQLIKSNITTISNKDDLFNSDIHEIIKTSEGDANIHKHGQIKDIISLGYLYKGEVIRKANIEVYVINN